MNWKDAPHLFTNEKFRVKCDNSEFLQPPYIGEFEPEMIKNVNNRPTYYTLIARPISDMTDEELLRVNDLHSDSEPKEYEKEDVERFKKLLVYKAKNPFRQNRREFLYLLSIGVYPFDDDTDVIFKPEQQ